MKCPQCGQLDTRVIDSRPAEAGASLRRRRSCDSCGYRFTTHERVIQSTLFIVKKDGRREEFSSEKLRGGIASACNKRPVSTDAIDRTVSEIEIALRQEAGSEVASSKVGEVVMNKLFELDQVAFVRFASVYQRFDDVRRFAQLLDRMTRNTRRRGKAKTDDERTGEGHRASEGDRASAEIADATEGEATLMAGEHGDGEHRESLIEMSDSQVSANGTSVAGAH